MNSQEISQLAVEIVQRLPQPLPLSVAMWDSQHIGQFMLRTPRHVMEHVVCLPTFPKARKMPKAQPLWKASEVISWVEQYKEK